MAGTRKVILEELDEREEAIEEAVAEATAEEEAEVAEEEVVEDEVEDDEAEPLDTDELFAGGPTFGKIKEWKEEFGKENIFVSVLNPSTEEYCIWRTLNREEYRKLVKDLEKATESGTITEADATMNNEESITEICCLYPTFNRHDRKNTNAGFPKMISEDVMEQSGFVQVEVRKL